MFAAFAKKPISTRLKILSVISVFVNFSKYVQMMSD